MENEIILKKLQAKMPNKELIEKVKHIVSELAKTGGKSHIMRVPPEVTDTDMILSELVRRFEILTYDNRKVVFGAASTSPKNCPKCTPINTGKIPDINIFNRDTLCQDCRFIIQKGSKNKEEN